MTIRSLLALSFFSFGSVPLFAQALPSQEVALDYTYIHTNAPPGGCGCFSMHGGGGSYAYHYRPSFALVVDAQAAHAAKIDATGLDLTLVSVIVGPRLYFGNSHARLAPYGQVLVGGARASGGLAPANSDGATWSVSFASTVGGGLEYHVSRAFTLRILEADYFLTTFDNNVNGAQNNLRITTGAAYRFGKK
jgi:outer membrane immunogenic protein